MTKLQSARRGEPLKVHPHCLLFFVDETGHEDFGDPNYPVFGWVGALFLLRQLSQICESRGAL
jgi:hypothetical protein